MSIHWRKEMAIDDSIIDEDHKLLIEIINTFEAAIKRQVSAETMGQGLKLLKHYTLEHFKREEELQRAVQYPFYQAHARDHRDLIKRVDQIANHLKASASLVDMTVVAKEILDLLKEWLVNHIIQSDLRMRPYVAGMKAHRQQMQPLRNHAAPPKGPSAA